MKVPASFIHGYSVRKDLLGLISIPEMAKSQPFCRVYFYYQNAWSCFTRDFRVDTVSITHRASDKSWWILGKNGEVIMLAGSTVKEEQILEAGLKTPFLTVYGYVNTIRNIGEELYVCGYGRQVYVRRANKWKSISDTILTQESGRGFIDIHGIDKKHIYAVGWHGEIYFYDGHDWHKDSSPTNVILESIKCVNPEEVWIAGHKGVVLHGRFNHWEVIKGEESINWYSIEEFNGKIYLAGHGLLSCLENDRIVRIDTGLGKTFSTHRLHARDGLLWSIGEKNILVFDGNKWEEILHPDNV